MTNGPIDGSAGDGDGKRQPLGKAGEQRGSACATGDTVAAFDFACWTSGDHDLAEQNTYSVDSL